MSIHVLSLLVLAGLFAAAALLPVNMGLLGFAAAFGVGVFAAGMAPKEVFAGFPADLFLTLVGVTYLFAFASANGAIDRLVDTAARAAGGRVAVVPWLVFALAGVLTAVGAPGPAAVAMLAPVTLRLAAQHAVSPLLMGIMLIHGTQSGAFSPSSVYGGITNGVAERAGLALEPAFLFFASLGVNLLIGTLAFLLLGGLRISRGHAVAASPPSASLPAATREQRFTWIAIAVLAVCSLGLGMNIGFVSVAVIALLSIVVPQGHAQAEKGVAWSTVLLICGIVTYVGVLEHAGTVTWLGESITALGMPLAGALLLCVLAGVVSAFASSTALLGVLVPLAVPMLAAGDLPVAGTVAAIAVATTIVDTSPFSSNGALVVANAAENERPALLRRLLGYTVLVVLAGPPLVWALLVVAAG